MFEVVQAVITPRRGATFVVYLEPWGALAAAEALARLQGVAVLVLYAPTTAGVVGSWWWWEAGR